MAGSFKDRIMGTILFIRSTPEKELAEFIVRLTDAVEGLNKNNNSFVKAFGKIDTEQAGAVDPPKDAGN